ncbi:MAG TPA: YncE family protein [Pyrinomonadaceae bacterium]|nr:YncE family protein [Pyrinomonadaceae bacterium]
MKRRPLLGLLLLAFCVAASCSAGRQAAAPVAGARPADAATTPGEQADGGALRPAGSIPLPQVRGRIDHMAVDVKGGRLFVAALGNNTLEVVDLNKGERVNSVSGFDEPQGLVYIPEAGRVVVANGGDGVVTFLDGQSLKTLKTVRTGGDADNVRYDPARGRVYVGYGDGALAVLSAEGERLGDVQLGGHPESFQLDGARIYVNVPSRHEVAVVDAEKLKVAETWPVSDAAANFPMALDAARHRLFVATRRPPRLLVYDTGTGKVISTSEAGGDSDDIFYDGERKRIYASFGEGSLFVYEQADADHYRLAGKMPTAAGARTALFSPELGRLFVAAPSRGDRTAEIMIYQLGS